MAQRATIGRCPKRNGQSSISIAGNGCRSRRSRRQASTTRLPPDAFVQMPPTQTNCSPEAALPDRSAAARPADRGPGRAEPVCGNRSGRHQLDRRLKDVGPDGSVRTVREGEREMPHDLHEREVTRGWLKASHRALDPARSKPWRPWHPLTQASAEEGHSRGNHRIRHRNHGDGKPVPARPPHLHRDRERRHADRRRRRDQRRICPEPHRAAARRRCTKSTTMRGRPSHLLLPVIPQANAPFGVLMSEARQVIAGQKSRTGDQAVPACRHRARCRKASRSSRRMRRRRTSCRSWISRTSP